MAGMPDPSSLPRAIPVEVTTARTMPRAVRPGLRHVLALGYPVGTSDTVPRALGLSRAALTAAGFSGRVGETLVVPSASGSLVAVGVGDEITYSVLRRAAAALVRAAGKRSTIITSLPAVGDLDPADTARAITEGALLAAYRFDRFRTAPANGGVTSLTLVVPSTHEDAAERGIAEGTALAAASTLARDLANTPPAYLTARTMAEVAVVVAERAGLEVEVFNRDDLATMGCGGIVGVNAASAEPPRMVRLRYRPESPTGHLALVGKGVMYDSGGLSLKPTNPMHAIMKMDMSGAAAVLGAMSVLGEMGCTTEVTGYLMCTDNMPSGSAMKLGDVLTFRNGKTAEIHNTDAEGRLVLADGLSLAVEDAPDAIVDIATLTGACIAALGPKIAGLLSTSDALSEQVARSATVADEPVWRLPLEESYRKMLDSNIADFRNVGGAYAGAITAALFLREFVGDVPWAHLDIAGPMNVDADDGVLTKGATGFGARLLVHLATGFRPPADG